MLPVFLPQSAFDASFAWAKAKVEAVVARDGGPIGIEPAAPKAMARDAIEAARAVLAKFGPRGVTFRILGRAEFAAGYYANAASSFMAAAKDGQEVSGALALARASLNEANGFELHHPDRKVIEARILRRREQELWAILHRRRSSELATAPDALPNDMPQISDVRVTIVDRASNIFTTRVIQRGDLGTDHQMEASLFVADLDGDGRQEAMAEGVFFGADWTPSCLMVVGVQAGKWTLSAPIKSHDPINIEGTQDPKSDPGMRLWTMNPIGDMAELSHAGQPRWLDFYRWSWSRGMYNADSDLPGMFVELERDLEHLIKRFPNDYQLLTYRARIERIRQGEPDLSWAAHAVAAAKRALHRDHDLPRNLVSQVKAAIVDDQANLVP